MSKIYLTSSTFKILEDRKPRQARERFVQYYRDLHALYKKEISEETFCEGPGYSFTELGSKVLDEFVGNNELQDLDLMVVVYWAHEFDPDHSSCGPFFAEKYQIKGQIIDVCDQGTISLFTGIHIIQQYLSNGDCKKALLLALEQTSIPRDKSENYLMPSRNIAAGIIFECCDETCSLNLVEAGILLESSLLQQPFNGFEFIQQCALKHKIKPNLMVFKRNTYLYKNYKFNTYINSTSADTKNISYLSNEEGYFPVMSYLDNLVNKRNKSNQNSIFLTAEDTETLSTGYLLLNKKK